MLNAGFAFYLPITPIKFVNAGFFSAPLFQTVEPRVQLVADPDTQPHHTHKIKSHLYLHEYFHINKTRTKKQTVVIITIGSSVFCPVLSFVLFFAATMSSELTDFLLQLFMRTLSQRTHWSRNLSTLSIKLLFLFHNKHKL